VLDGLHGEINVKLRPVQMVRLGTSDLEELTDGGLSKPWEQRERHEQLALIE
jgi:hypothetical protein